MKNTAHIRNNKLTVLIPFMNEGEEVAATVRDVRRNYKQAMRVHSQHHNINCPEEITASCIGYSDKGTNLNCGAHAKKCAGTLPPDTTEPTSTSSNIGEISESLLF